MVIKLKITRHVDKPKPMPTKLIVQRVGATVLAAKKTAVKKMVAAKKVITKVVKKAEAKGRKKVTKKVVTTKKSVAKKLAPIAKKIVEEVAPTVKVTKEIEKKVEKRVRSRVKSAEAVVKNVAGAITASVTKVEVGAVMPDFAMLSTSGGSVSKDSLLGARYVLYFYPKDMTPGCTTEAHEFSALAATYEAKGVKVFGVSSDSLASHEDFVAKENLRVPLLVDEDHELAKALGVWGGKYSERTTFVVSEGGLIERIYRDVVPLGHGVCVLNDLSA